MQEYFLGFGFEVHFLAFVLGSARLLTLAVVAPFMGNYAMNLTAKSAIVLSLYAVLHPALLGPVAALMPLSTPSNMVMFAILVIKEVFIGFMLAFLAGIVFWAVEGAGIFIDNQKGAGMASGTEPLSGAQSTPTGAFFFQSLCYVFYAAGAFLSFLALVYGTYETWPVGELLPWSFFNRPGSALFFGECVGRLALQFVLISAPVVLACLFTDISLGLVNRFASQLNVYVLAMPIKCGIASFLLLFYFSVMMSDAPSYFGMFGIDLGTLRELAK